MEQTNEPEYFTPAELADYLKVSLKFIRTHTNRIPGKVCVGHLVRYNRSAVTRALIGGKLFIERTK